MNNGCNNSGQSDAIAQHTLQQKDQREATNNR